MIVGWNQFVWFVVATILLSTVAAFAALRSEKRSRMAVVLSSAGVAVLTLFVALLWITLWRPPLRTMGETRLGTHLP